MPAGRPSDYTPEIAFIICEEIAAGHSLVSICKRDDMPGRSTVRQWLEKQPEFASMYAHAREDQAEAYADKIMDAAEQDPVLTTTTGEGWQKTAIDTGEIQNRKLKIDALKWIASKLKPKVYGDKLELDATVKQLVPDVPMPGSPVFKE